MKSYNIVLADDHVIFRQGMKALIDEAPGLAVVGEAGDGFELLKLLDDVKPDMVILVIGANDGLRGISPDLLYDNLDRIVGILKTNRIRIVLGGMKMLTNLGPDYVEKFERVYPEIAGKHQVTLIPFFLEGIAGEKKFNQADGIHPNAAGYAKLVEHIYPYIVQTIGGKTP